MNIEVAKAIPEDETEHGIDAEAVSDDDDEGSNDFTDTVVLSEDSLLVDDVSTAEINVEKLIEEVAKADNAEAARKKEVRRRLEELAERKLLDDTFSMEFDAD